jgi:DNA-directed RNA polymerase specialized sigma24 family protein
LGIPLDDPSVTLWLELLKAGDRAAVQPLWERYFEKLVGLARRRLQNRSRRAADEEDVALSAFQSFWEGAAAGKFPQLEDRDDLWQILLMLTQRKAIDQVQRERRQKRGGGAVRGDSVFEAEAAGGTRGFDGLPDSAPSPSWALQVAEECSSLLAALPAEELRRIAVLKMGGESNEEIAARLNCAVRTVERKLTRIRSVWSASKK